MISFGSAPPSSSGSTHSSAPATGFRQSQGSATDAPTGPFQALMGATPATSGSPGKETTLDGFRTADASSDGSSDAWADLPTSADASRGGAAAGEPASEDADALLADAPGADQDTGADAAEAIHPAAGNERAFRQTPVPPASTAPGTEPNAAGQTAARALAVPGSDATAGPVRPQAPTVTTSATTTAERATTDTGRPLTAAPNSLETRAPLPNGGSGSGNGFEALLASARREASGSGAQTGAVTNPAADARPDGLAASQRLTPAAEWAPVKVDTQHIQWSRDLAAALGDRLQMQVSQQVKEASVRLDPPELGRIELTVRMDGDRLNIQLHASNGQVRDLLSQHAERLRMDLMAQNGQTVDVQVGQHSGGERHGHNQPQPAERIIANTTATPDDRDHSPTPSDRWLSTSA
ncbi:flagellar hook-length control protein FliK [Marinobacter sp. CA1]|uniref:flagellar hook-length control protein FliK n=1 Tax=Marinobacter sp. CA1 TaxID=2817656 RepID=UPI001D08D6CB|nr:flagellar hook-length control protein FliK [Marinobacter sp. CA1]UDL05518.1 flagellar hook-length control protein FliK [Marinobacter sp. CA1]